MADPTSPLRVLVVSDTHLTMRTLERMPAEVWALAEAADVVVHAGDVVDRAVLDALAERGPVHAVLGNNDAALAGQLPEVLELRLAGVAVGVIHDSGATAGRRARLARRFPDARVAIFGHSHDPVLDDEDGLLLVNPGSPVQRRRQPVHTVAWLELADGAGGPARRPGGVVGRARRGGRPLGPGVATRSRPRRR